MMTAITNFFIFYPFGKKVEKKHPLKVGVGKLISLILQDLVAFPLRVLYGNDFPTISQEC
jgi:hypothetical protein